MKPLSGEEKDNGVNGKVVKGDKPETPTISFISYKDTATVVEIPPAIEQEQPEPQQVKKPSWTCHYVLSVLVSVFCCFVPCSVIGLVHFMSAKVENSKGNNRGALKKKRRATAWTACGFLFGTTIVVLLILAACAFARFINRFDEGADYVIVREIEPLRQAVVTERFGMREETEPTTTSSSTTSTQTPYTRSMVNNQDRWGSYGDASTTNVPSEYDYYYADSTTDGWRFPSTTTPTTTTPGYQWGSFFTTPASVFVGYINGYILMPSRTVLSSMFNQPQIPSRYPVQRTNNWNFPSTTDISWASTTMSDELFEQLMGDNSESTTPSPRSSFSNTQFTDELDRDASTTISMTTTSTAAPASSTTTFPASTTTMGLQELEEQSEFTTMPTSTGFSEQQLADIAAEEAAIEQELQEQQTASSTGSTTNFIEESTPSVQTSTADFFTDNNVTDTEFTTTMVSTTMDLPVDDNATEFTTDGDIFAENNSTDFEEFQTTTLGMTMDDIITDVASTPEQPLDQELIMTTPEVFNDTVDGNLFVQDTNATSTSSTSSSSSTSTTAIPVGVVDGAAANNEPVINIEPVPAINNEPIIGDANDGQIAQPDFLIEDQPTEAAGF